ncbi:MAG: GDSL-type esterase/lipase family protein, partial [Clostridia bacterium]
GLSPTPVLFGFSRGGLYAFQYACAHPQRVSALYLDAPVLDIRSWPGAQGASSGYDETCWRDCLRWYGLDEQSVLHFHQNPLDKAGQLAAQGVPILLIAGLMDKVVPFMENGAILQARYLQAGGDIQVITKDHCDHHPHSLEDPTPIVQWVQTHQRPMHPTLEAKEWTNLWYEEAADHTKPRILLVGDSISNGYCHAVNDVLAGRAYANSFATSMALDHPGFLPALDAAWGQNGYTYDLVHFNNGLHGWHLSDASYGAHYERVVRHIRTQYPATRIVLVLSTPVCLPGPDMILDPEKDDAVQSRNRIVQEIARRYQLPVNDLYHAMLGRNDDRTTDGYHYQASGVAYQGAHVAQYLLAQLSR